MGFSQEKNGVYLDLFYPPVSQKPRRRGSDLVAGAGVSIYTYQVSPVVD
jgi:hypothetical protein